MVDDIATLVPDSKYMELMSLLQDIYNKPTRTMAVVHPMTQAEIECIRRSRDNFKYKFKKERRRLNDLKELHNDIVDELREEVATLSEQNRRLINTQCPVAETGTSQCVPPHSLGD